MAKLDPERMAAAFLAGTLRPRPRQSFEAHLLACDSCWREVQAGRAGRAVAERGRELATPALRDRVRSALTAEQPELRRRWPSLLATGALGLAVVVLAAVAVVAVIRRPAAQPPAIVAAVAGYQQHRLPGSGVPANTLPDLSALHLSLVAAGAGELERMAVSAYVYRDPAGLRLVVYRSAEPFPTARGARLLAGRDGPWLLHSDGVTVLCARQPHALLVLSEDAELVRAAGDALGVL